MTLPTLFILVIIYLIGSIAWYGRRKGYSHIRHTISELGERGAVNSRNVNYFVFLPVGVLLLATGAMAWWMPSPTSHCLAGLSVSIGMGYAVAAFFPCDPGSPMGGTWTQQIHNLGGAVEYLGGAFFISRFHELEKGNAFFPNLAGLILVAAVLMSIQPLFKWRGAIQRVADTALFLSLLLMSWGR